MAEEYNRSASLWERITYTVYLRLGTIIASILTLIAGALALNEAMKYESAGTGEEGVVESGERPTDGSLIHQTLAVTGTLTAAAAATLLLQTVVALASKFCVYIYEPALPTLIHLKLTEFLTNSILLVTVTASATAEAVVAYHWTSVNKDHRDEDLFKAVAGSTTFGFLSGLLLSVLCIVTFCTFHSLQRSHNQHKTIGSTVAV